MNNQSVSPLLTEQAVESVTPVRKRASQKLRTKGSNKRTSALLPIPCGCGCLETFQPIRRDQKYLPEHRFRTYKTHKCADCGTVHRMAVPRG